jgi:hypothetical protein
MRTIKITPIYNNNGTLAFEGEPLATLQDYCRADRCEGSIFEALKPGDVVELLFLDCYLMKKQKKLMELDEDLDLIHSDSVWWERIGHEAWAGLMRVQHGGILPGEAPLRDYFCEGS